MRGLFLLLLLTNLAFLTWQFVGHQVDRSEAKKSVVVVPPVNEGLTLLSEVAQEERPSLREEADNEMVTANLRKDGTRHSTLSHDKEVSAGQEISGAEGENAGAGFAVCLGIEDIEDETGLLRLLKMLEGNDAVLIERGEKQGTKTNYWVMLPPYSNRAKADQAAAILSGKKIKDFFIIRSGEYENAVSLGVFSAYERAKRRYNQIVALKVRLRRPRIETIKLPAKRYYATFSVQDAKSQANLVALMGRLRYPPPRKVKCR